MFSLGGTELLLIAAVVLMLFGPDKIPQFARTVGRFMREFNKYKDIMESTLRTEMYAAEAKSDGVAEGTPVSDLEKLEKSAEGSRQYAAEHAAGGASTADDSDDAVDLGAAAPNAATTSEAPAHAKASVIAVDEEEDEEEGR